MWRPRAARSSPASPGTRRGPSRMPVRCSLKSAVGRGSTRRSAPLRGPWRARTKARAAGLFVNTMLNHSVTERRAEFAVLRAIGFPGIWIVLTVALESLTITVECDPGRRADRRAAQRRQGARAGPAAAPLPASLRSLRSESYGDGGGGGFDSGQRQPALQSFVVTISPRAIRALTVADIMSTGVLTAGCSATIAEAAALMVERRVGSIVVVDDPRRRPIGILTERDLVRFAASGADAAVTLVTEYMTPDPIPPSRTRRPSRSSAGSLPAVTATCRSSPAMN